MSLEALDGSRVVVVDDNLPSAQLVRALLARFGLRSVEAIADPREFLERVEQLAPQLVILDLHMPGIDGYGVLAELRRRAAAADLPVLVLTADTTREATHKALRLGANDFLTKPLDAHELMLRVRNLLEAGALHVELLGRHRWLEASARLSADLLSDEGPEPLRRVAELACAAAEADFAVVAVPGPDSTRSARQLISRIQVGRTTPEAGHPISAALESGRLPADSPTLLADLEDGSVGPVLLVPLRGRDRLIGALAVGRAPGRPRFGEIDLSLAQGFAGQAAVGVELAEARADQARMLLLTERHRIARDLHDQVIQRLFATGLRLQQVADRMEPGPLADRIGEHVGDLDDTITEIRSTIFGLRQSVDGEMRLRLRALVDELAEVLGFEPKLWFDTSLDAVPDDLGDDLVLAAREALTNVARHASARHAEVSVSLTDVEVVLEVRDDGVGVGDAYRRSGLTYLSERALRHGGNCRVTAVAGGGTHVEWRARLVPGGRPVTIPSVEAAHSSTGTIVTGR